MQWSAQKDSAHHHPPPALSNWSVYHSSTAGSRSALSSTATDLYDRYATGAPLLRARGPVNSHLSTISYWHIVLTGSSPLVKSLLLNRPLPVSFAFSSSCSLRSVIPFLLYPATCSQQ